MQVSWPPLPFSALRAAGFAVPQGVVLCNRVDRNGSPAIVCGAPAVAVRHEQPQEPLEVVALRRLRLLLLPLRFRSRRRSRGLVCALIESRRLMVSFLDLLWVNLFTKIFFCERSFAERVSVYAEVNESSSSTRVLQAAVAVSCEL